MLLVGDFRSGQGWAYSGTRVYERCRMGEAVRIGEIGRRRILLGSISYSRSLSGKCGRPSGGNPRAACSPPALHRR
jgi:hypothetical protein